MIAGIQSIRARARRWGAWGALIALLALPAIPLGPRPAGAQEPDPVDAAWAAFRAGRYQEALRATEGDPSRDATLLRIALLRRTGRSDEAIAAAEAACQDDSPDGRLLHALGCAYRDRGRSAESRAAFERARAARPNDPAILVACGLALMEAGDGARAGETFLAAVRIYQQATGLTYEDLVACAQACRQLERFDEIRRRFRRPMAEYARQMFDEARRLSGADSDPEVWIGWAELYLDKFDYPESRRLYERALSLDPGHPGALIGLARANIIDGYEGTDRYDRARSALAHALDADPHSADAHATLAGLAFLDADYDAARREAEAALATNPRHVEALAILGALAYTAADPDAFRAIETRARELGLYLADFYWQVAQAIEGKYLFREAAELCQRAILLDSGFHPAMMTLGLNYVRLGDEERGRRFLERSHDADPYNVFTFNTLQVLDEIRDHYVTRESEHFVIKLHETEVEVMLPYVTQLLEEAWHRYRERYRFEPPGKILFEMFPNVNWFSARTIGLPFIGASGACFGAVVTMWSPRAVPPGAFTWGETLWHELAHVFTVERSGHRIPRWFTEGLSVLEESNGRPYWVRTWDRDLLDAIAWGRILPITELDSGFTRPRFPNQVMLSYYQGGRTCQFIEQLYGFDKILAMIDAYRQGASTDRVIREVLGADPAAFDAAFSDWLAGQYAAYHYRPAGQPADIDRLRQHLDLHPDDVSAWGELALCHMDLGHRADAEIAADRALELSPASGDAHLATGLIALSRGDRTAARAAIERSLALGTRDPLRAHLVLADIIGTTDPPAALAHVREAAALFPGEPSILQREFAMERDLGLDADARRTLEALCRSSSTEIQGRLDLLDLAAGEGQWDEVRSIGEQMIWLQPFVPDPHLQLARAANRTGEFPMAAAEAEMALRTGYGDVEAVKAEMLEAKVGQGDLAAARALAIEILTANPDQPRAFEVLRAIDQGSPIPPRRDEEPPPEETTPPESPEGPEPPAEPAPPDEPQPPDEPHPGEPF